MGKADVNCYIGRWPFRKLGKNTLSDLKEVHSNNGISTGFVSSLNSIFYNDPFEGDEELHEIIKGSGYYHVLTINPTLPCCLEDIERGIRLFDIKGVKIFPGYHNYKLDDPCVKALCETLERLNLPLFIVMRMEDERLDYLMSPRILMPAEISKFIEKKWNFKIVLLNIRLGEILECKDQIISNSNVFFDTCGLKDSMFNVEQLCGVFGDKKMMYGSLFPMYCLKSSYLLVDKADIPEQSKINIFANNMKALLS